MAPGLDPRMQSSSIAHLLPHGGRTSANTNTPHLRTYLTQYLHRYLDPYMGAYRVTYKGRDDEASDQRHHETDVHCYRRDNGDHRQQMPSQSNLPVNELTACSAIVTRAFRRVAVEARSYVWRSISARTCRWTATTVDSHTVRAVRPYTTHVISSDDAMNTWATTEYDAASPAVYEGAHDASDNARTTTRDTVVHAAIEQTALRAFIEAVRRIAPNTQETALSAVVRAAAAVIVPGTMAWTTASMGFVTAGNASTAACRAIWWAGRRSGDHAKLSVTVTK